MQNYTRYVLPGGERVPCYATTGLAYTSYLTNNELKLRANSMAHSQYKAERRDKTRKESRKRLNWFRNIILAQIFVSKLKKRWEQSKKDRH